MTKNFGWEILRAVVYNGSRLALVARRTRDGRHVQPGLTFEEKVNESFPRLIAGGGLPGNWDGIKSAFNTVEKNTRYASRATEEQIVEVIQPMWRLLDPESNSHMEEGSTVLDYLVIIGDHPEEWESPDDDKWTIEDEQEVGQQQLEAGDEWEDE